MQTIYSDPQFSEHSRGDYENPLEDRRSFAFLTPLQWVIGILFSGLALTPFYTYTATFGWLASLSTFLFFLTLFHFVASLGHLIPIPHIAIFSAAISYVFAPLVSFYAPPTNTSYTITQPELYFDYAAPAFCVVVIGWFAPFFLLKRPLLLSTHRNTGEYNVNDRNLLVMFWIGLFFTLLRFFVPLPPLLSFIIILLSHFRYISCGAWVFGGRRDRVLFTAGTLLLELFQSIYTSMFHEFFLWAACIFCLWAGGRSPSRLFAITTLLLGSIILLPLQQAKTRYRKTLSNTYGQVDSNKDDSFVDSVSGRLDIYRRSLSETFKEHSENVATDRTLGDEMVRFNQGWLVARVINYVPSMEPLAEGETVKSALIGAALPRFLYKGKVETGGRDFLRRFTGIYLTGNTSMNIGYLGEMYGNFGRIGGITGCFIYAFVLSTIFNWVSFFTSNRPQLIGLIPFLCFRMPVAESDLSDIFNYIFKALIVIGLIRVISPSFFRTTSRIENPRAA